MGSRIAALALPPNDPPFTVTGAVEAKGHPMVGQDVGQLLQGKAVGVVVTHDVNAALQNGDALIEFTSPHSTLEHLRIAAKLKKPTVIGTTGFRSDEEAIIAAFAKEIPIVFSPNMSVGVNLLFELARLATERLGLRYDIAIVEAHHRTKQDSPSGTAKRLQEIISEARSPSKIVKESIPYHSIRVGDIVGEHTVIFAGPHERLELTHRASSRDVFAVGALRAAQFIVRQPPGLYDMSHVLKASHG